MSSRRRRTSRRYCLQRERSPRGRPWSLTVYDFGCQLQRLLETGADRDREVYNTLVDEICDSADPLKLFSIAQRQPGIRFIEAMYRTHATQAGTGDYEATRSLARLCYSRWVAWRNYGDAVGCGARVFGDQRSVGDFIACSKRDLVRLVREGCEPDGEQTDQNLHRLFHDLDVDDSDIDDSDVHDLDVDDSDDGTDGH